MKTILFMLLLTVLGAQPSAGQETRPNRENSTGKTGSLKEIPEKAEVNTIALQSIFSKRKGESITIRFNEHFTVDGVVVEKVKQSSGATTVNIKSAEYPGVLFNFSTGKKASGEEVIRARIISRGSADALVLVKENSRYFLKHTPQDKLIVE